MKMIRNSHQDYVILIDFFFFDKLQQIIIGEKKTILNG